MDSNNFKLYLTAALTFILVMLGVSGNADNYTAQNNDVIESVESQYSFSSDYDGDECVMPTEGNVFSSVNLSQYVHQMRVQVRRKCFGNAWGGFAATTSSTERLMYSSCYTHNRTNDLNQPRKDYFISLRKFII